MSHRKRIAADVIDPLLARPQGMSIDEGCLACGEANERSMLKRLQHLKDYKQAWSAKIPGKLAHRWFSDQSARDAWQDANPPLPSLKQQRLDRRQNSGPTLTQRMLALVQTRGGRGTLCADLSAEIGRPSGTVGGWVTDMEHRGLLDSVMHRKVRIIYPAGVPLLPGALQACQRRIDCDMGKRGPRTGKFSIVKSRPVKPGQAAGVVLAPISDWRHWPAANAGAVAPQIQPAPWIDCRYQVDPLSRIEGGFRSLRPGQYDTPASNAVTQYLNNRREA